MYPQVIDGLGLWFERHDSINPTVRRPALFLDRDGVIVEETHYLGRSEDVCVIPGAAEAVARANRAGYAVIVVSNQAGIGRGYYNWDGFVAVQDRIREELSVLGAHFDAVLACAYHEQALGAFARPNHLWRKPNPGMIEAAGEALNLDLGRSLIIGDKVSDIEAGFRAGLRRAVLVETGYGMTERAQLAHELAASMEIKTARDLGSAISALDLRT